MSLFDILTTSLCFFSHITNGPQLAGQKFCHSNPRIYEELAECVRTEGGKLVLTGYLIIFSASHCDLQSDPVMLQMVSGLCKVTAGRLRPHFMSVCQPNLTDSSCGRWERPQYVTNFTCSGNLQLFPEPAEREQRLAEARLSFLSGHASLSWYGGVFSAGYIQTSATRHRNVSCLPLVLVQVSIEVQYLSVCSLVMTN